MTEFPKWKYHATKQALIVDDKDAEEALGLGWFDTPAEAQAAAPDDDVIVKESAESHRKELLALARSLGIEIYHTSGAEKIQAAIDAHNEDNA